jgi:hypothetical protein
VRLYSKVCGRSKVTGKETLIHRKGRKERKGKEVIGLRQAPKGLQSLTPEQFKFFAYLADRDEYSLGYATTSAWLFSFSA